MINIIFADTKDEIKIQGWLLLPLPKSSVKLHLEVNAHDVDISKSWIISSKDRDVQNGIAAGCNTVLLSNEHFSPQDHTPTFYAPSLQDAVKIILANAET